MKKRQHFKFKRLILRIVSVISVISILLSSIVISAFANNGRYDSVSLYGYKGDYVMRECGVGTGYSSNISGGTNGTVFSRSKRFSLTGEQFICYMDNIPNSDVDIALVANPNGLKFVYVQFQFNDYYDFYSNTNYSVSLPLKLVFYNYGGAYDDNGIYAIIRQDKLSLINYTSDRNYYYDVWDVTNINISSNWTFTLNFNFTPTQDFQCNGMLFGFNIQPRFTTAGLGEIITSSPDMNALSILPRPNYIMPDFSDQENNQALEDDIRQNGGDAFAQLDNFYESLGHLGESFEYIKTSMFKSTFIFSTFFTEGGLLSDILYFSLVIGLCGFIIGAIGSVAGWATGLGGREFGRLRNAKERDASRDFNRRNRRR